MVSSLLEFTALNPVYNALIQYLILLVITGASRVVSWQRQSAVLQGILS